MKDKKQTTIEIDKQTIDDLLARIESRQLDDKDYKLIENFIFTVVSVNAELEKKKLSINRLRKLFNIKTEKSKNLIPAEKQDRGQAEQAVNKTPKEKKKGHGRIKATDYKNAEWESVHHTELEPGCPCPDCEEGKLYPCKRDSVFVRITATPIFQAKVFKRDNLRCNLCGKIFPAPLPWLHGRAGAQHRPAPKGVSDQKYDESVSSMIVLLKYGSGFPFYRMRKLQDICGTPFPESTQWELVEKAVNKSYPVYKGLIKSAAQADTLHNDDTNIKILSLLKENKTIQDQERKGIFTTGIIARKDEITIALYYSGRNHAGENIAKLLSERCKANPPPIQMCDALSRNIPKDFKVLLAHCLIHGRRNFVDIINSFPSECTYVIEALREVYCNDAVAKEEKMTPEARLEYHKQKSGPVMDELNKWMHEQFDKRKVEPNSGLGHAIEYMLKYWPQLTLFLHVAGAPLDNNIVERALKKVILHRKNALFYKTEFGALAGDVFMSIIQTCVLMKVNALEYLVAIQKNYLAVKADSAAWMPWNYTIALARPAEVVENPPLEAAAG